MSEPEDLESCKARSPFRSRSPVVVSPRGFGVPAALLAAVGLLVLPVTRATADDWPQWLGPSRDGVSAERGWLKSWPPSGPSRLWEKKIGHGFSGIVVAKGRLLLFHRVADELILESLDALTGKSG